MSDLNQDFNDLDDRNTSNTLERDRTTRGEIGADSDDETDEEDTETEEDDLEGDDSL